MAARIYSLAKELKLDSKVLVDICAKAGVTGKGSALASLTDDEVSRIKAFMTGGAAATKQAPKEAARPVVATATVPEMGAIRREDYLAPAGVAGTAQPLSATLSAKLERPAVELPRKPPIDLSRKPPLSDAARKQSAGDTPRAPQRTGPAIRVAPLPTAQQPPPPVQPAEPAPQKPDIKLPPDAIRAGKAGATPLQAHLRKHEAKRKAEAAASTHPAGPERAPVAPPTPGGVRGDRGRRGAKPAPAAAATDTLGGREQRQLNRKRATETRRTTPGGDDDQRHRKTRRPKRANVSTTAPRKGRVVVTMPCNIRSFSAAIGVPVTQVLAKMMSLGTVSTITSDLSAEMVELLAVEFGAEIDVRASVSLEDQLLKSIEDREDAPESLRIRPPVVTFLGHVDHGKTSLLDRIIGIDVASGESGGITQHIRAYRIDRNNRPIAFVDTPGHEAFTEMRARGANVTDIAVLVVAADDGVMPQTEEAISHARAAEVPIVVALNKIDLPGIDTQRIFQQLATNGLLPTEWGGDTEVVRCSAMTGAGIDELLETLLTIAELHEFKVNPDGPARGTCLEAEIHEDRGVIAKLLVQNGTLHVGDIVVCGGAYGRVKAMHDTLEPRRLHQQAEPSMPVNVTGLDKAPGAGDHFYVLDEISVARSIAEKRLSQTRQVTLSGQALHVTLETLHERLGGDQVQTLNLILRADTRGSIEAIQKEFTKLEHPEVQIKILQATVGGITEADVTLADASDAIIIGFNVVPDEGARGLADARGVQIRRYEIIYQVTDDLRAALEGMLKPEKREVELGRALVQRTFVISRIGTIAGCRVLVGTIERNSRVRVIRENRIIGDYPLESLKREKDDAREVREGFECGMKLGGFNDLKEGDVLEVYKIEEIARTL